MNYLAGWWLILGAFASGALMGLGFHRDDFLGGYGSLRRRLFRLGHVAFAALGGLNVLYGLCPVPMASAPGLAMPDVLLLCGGIAMPVVCFLAGWRSGFRHLFVVPVSLLVGSVAAILFQGVP